MTRPLLAIIATAAILAGCGTTPAATELPDEPVRSRPATAPAAGPEKPPPATRPTGDEAALTVEPLDLRGVRGGRVTVGLDGTPDRVLEMLLDFDAATGRRPWAVRYRTVRRDADRVVAHWTFEGKAGIDPEVDILFEVRRAADVIVVRYHLVAAVFGLGAFFGDYRIAPDPTDPARSILTERVFIDSGLWIANATADDIESGLDADARAMRDWMNERLHGVSNPE